jgi:hypothetical protein
MHAVDAGVLGAAGLSAYGAASGGIGYRCVSDLLGFGSAFA